MKSDIWGIVNKNISEIIKRRKIIFNKDAQRAELLARNEIFQTELRKINKYISKEFHQLKNLSKEELRALSKNNILLKLDYPKKCTSEKDFWRIHNELQNNLKALFHIFPLNAWYVLEDGETTSFRNKLEEVIFHKFNIFDAFLHLWKGFCTKWHIHPDWDENLDSLGKFQQPLVEIITGHFLKLDNYTPLPIIIRIGPWTTLEDIREIWSKIERIQKTKFYKEEKTSNFARDLCWFDLNKKFNLSHRQIAELWITNYPEDFDLLVLRRIIKEIDKQDLEGRVFDESELINEVKSGILSKKYKNKFETEKHYYLTGQTDRGKKTPPLVEVIKKAIKNFDKRIHVLDLPSETRV